MKQGSILIVDDDKIILDSLCEFLKLEGYNAVGAGSYKQAISLLQKNKFTLVITDVNLPDGNGMELLGLIKKNYPQIVVLVITGYGTIESAVEAIKLGANDYLTKPIKVNAFMDALNQALERADEERDGAVNPALL